MLTELFLLVLCAFIGECSILPHPPVFTPPHYYPPICYLPPDSGLCNSTLSHIDWSDERCEGHSDLLTRFYFDTVTEQCYQFGVQNCGGNENRFETLAKCQNFCQKLQSTKPISH
ncbi:hypothetical protein AB6A40_008955 [Gnathostoma spinigerum]|uniref:BPTI/Kunitz inhibitor domain-containing protein n=1 Tax=Gnathostoma spinigerum TaxID=75299 RepID=A0ABD6ESE2_9BILA